MVQRGTRDGELSRVKLFKGILLRATLHNQTSGFAVSIVLFIPRADIKRISKS